MTGSRQLPRAAGTVRARAVRDAYRADRERGREPTYRTPAGVVTIVDLVYREGPDGTACVELNVVGGAGTEPHFRIFNPPTLVPDPQGDVVVRGQRFRVDPLLAVATAVALHRSSRKAVR